MNNIIQKRETFLKLKFEYFKGVFIPHIITKRFIILVEKFLFKKEVYTIIDMCSGSGIIGLSLSKLFSIKKTYCIDTSSTSRKNIEHNIVLNSFKDIFVMSGLSKIMIGDFSQTVLVSNPPYIGKTERNSSSIKKFEDITLQPKKGLYTKDLLGLSLFKIIASFAYLKKIPYVFLEHNSLHKKELDKLMLKKDYECVYFDQQTKKISFYQIKK